MNLQLLQPAVRDYLMDHIHENAASFLLKSHPFKDITTQELTQQLVGLQKARSKFPLLFENKEILFPPKMNLEQTSSWSTALYKASLFTGENMIDITGGFGIDVSAFAKACPKTTHIELNSSLQELAAQSLKAQGLTTKSHCEDGISYLKNSNTFFDLIYIDPSRKTASNTKAILLEDYEPNVIKNLDLLLKKGHEVMIKTSPMLDITAGLKQLRNVNNLHIVAVKNEVKELLWILEKESSDVSINCINLETDQSSFSFTWNENSVIELNQISTYLYEPNAAIMKAQAFGEICEKFKLSKIDHDAHLFTSGQLIDFPGRRFKVKKVQPYKPKDIKRAYGKSARAVVIRNFRESVNQLRNKFKFTEHESDYLFFTSLQGKPIVIEAEKL